MDRTAPPLIVATRLGWGGETGVHRHIETMLEHAPQWGVEPVFVSPWTRPRVVRRALRAIGHLLKPLSSERAHIWVQWGFGRLIRARSRRVLRRYGRPGGVVYAQDPATAVALLGLRRRFPRMRIVLGVHYNGSEAAEMIDRGIARPDGPITRRLDHAERRAFEGCDAVVCPSEYTRTDVLTRLGDASLRSRVHVVPHVIEAPADGERTSAAVRSDEERAPDRLITIGTLEPRKNHRFLIDLVACLRARGLEVNLTIVGQGPLRDSLEEHACRRGVRDRIDLVGLQIPAAPLISEHDLYVHSARMESFGIVLVEALARGRPVAAPLVGAIPEIFRPGREGIGLDLGDLEASADQLERLLRSPAAYRSMCEDARARYESSFGPERVLRRWHSVITGTVL